jgi:hypothetical protein
MCTDSVVLKPKGFVEQVFPDVPRYQLHASTNHALTGYGIFSTEIGFCHRLQMIHTQFVAIDGVSPYPETSLEILDSFRIQL